MNTPFGICAIAALTVAVLGSHASADIISPASQDTYLDGRGPTEADTSRDGGTVVVVNSSTNRVGVFKFDLSGLTPSIVNAPGFQAEFQARVNFTLQNPVDFKVYQLTTDWVTSATFNEADPVNDTAWMSGAFSTTDYLATAAASHSTTNLIEGSGQPAGYNTVIDITSLVQTWVNDPSTNKGLALIGDNAGEQINIEEAESPGTFEPQIVSVPEPASLVLMGLGCLAMASRRR